MSLATEPLPGGLSGDSYLDRRLRPLDAEHYSAAGLLPYRRQSGGGLELLLAQERPWNSFTQAYDALAWNVFGGKRIPRLERSYETTAVRCFQEAVSQVSTVPPANDLYSLLGNASSFALWYPQGKFALLMLEVTEDEMSDLPEKFLEARKQAGPQSEYRVLPSGVRKYVKQIEALGWVPAKDVLPESGKEVTDLLRNVLNVGGFSDFIDGKLDPTTAWPEVAEGAGGVDIGKGGGKKGKDASKGYKGKGGKGGKAMGYGSVYAKGGKAAGKGSMMAYNGKGINMAYAPYMQKPEEVQRQMYGEQLYVLVQPLSPSPYLAQKITGMLLELPLNELILNLTNQEELSRRVSEAVEVLKEDGVVQ